MTKFLKRSRINPEASHINPEDSQINTEARQINPEDLQFNTEAQRINPEGLQINTEAPRINPEGLQINPEALRTSIENVTDVDLFPSSTSIRRKRSPYTNGHHFIVCHFMLNDVAVTWVHTALM